MAIQVREAICSDTSFPITILRPTTGGYDQNGEWQSGPVRKIKALASVQPVEEKINNNLGNDRVDRRVRFISNRPLQFSDKEAGIKSDVIYYKKEYYTLRRDNEDWSDFGVHSAVGSRIEELNCDYTA